MVSASDIRDHESLRAWLEDQPREVAVEISTRVALWLAPLFWASVARQTGDPDLTELAILRATLIAGVGAVRSSQAIRAAASAADGTIVRAATATAIDANADRAAIATARNAIATVAAGAADADARAAAAHAAAIAADADAAFGREIRVYCVERKAGAGPMQLPLWTGAPPDWFPAPLPHRDWPGRVPEHGPAWQFWHDWYEGYLTGHPLDIDLLTEVALIDPGVWDAGEAAVNARIEEILLAHAGRRARSGIVVDFNSETNRFRQEDVSAQAPGGLAHAVAKLREIDALAESSGNLAGVLRAEFFLIRRAVNDHADNPVMVYFNSKAARDILQGNLANGSCPSISQEPVVGVIDTTLVEVQAALWAEPEVRETAEQQAEDSQILDDPVALRVIEAAADDVAEASEGHMAEELPEDARLARDQHQPRALRRVALLAVVSRLVQVWALIGRSLDEVENVTAKVARISDNTAKIFGNAEKIARSARNIAVIAGGLGGTRYVALHPELISQAIHYIAALF